MTLVPAHERSITRAQAEAAAKRPLTDREAAMLRHVGLGGAGQPRVTIDQQSFDLDNDGRSWAREKAIWYCTMVALALARLVAREGEVGRHRPLARILRRRRRVAREGAR